MSVNPENYLPKALSTNVKNTPIYHNLNPNNQKVNVEILNNEGMKCLEFLNKDGNSSQWKSSLFNLKMIILIISLYGLFNQYSLICCSNTSSSGTAQHSHLSSKAQNLIQGLDSNQSQHELFWEFMEKYESMKLNTKNITSLPPEEN